MTSALLIVAIVVLLAVCFKVREELRGLRRDGVIAEPRTRSTWKRWRRRKALGGRIL